MRSEVICPIIYLVVLFKKLANNFSARLLIFFIILRYVCRLSDFLDFLRWILLLDLDTLYILLLIDSPHWSFSFFYIVSLFGIDWTHYLRVDLFDDLDGSSLISTKFGNDGALRLESVQYSTTHRKKKVSSYLPITVLPKKKNKTGFLVWRPFTHFGMDEIDHTSTLPILVWLKLVRLGFHV